jgi:molybdopterin/thiamine biosynthesis adenylyltransferase
VRLDDAQIERYSRQLILPEIGPGGQATLAGARVAIASTGAAAERVVAYLAAAGVGTLALPPTLRQLVDPAQSDVTLEALPAVTVAVRSGEPDASFDAALGEAGHDTVRASHAFWVCDGRVAELPPCAVCAAAALGPPEKAEAVLVPLRDALLGTIVATEIVKALLGLGTSLRGHVLTYEPESATFTRTPVAARATCPCLRGAVPADGRSVRPA